MTDGIDGVSSANGALTPTKAPQTQQKVERVNAPDSGRDGSDVVSLTDGGSCSGSSDGKVGRDAAIEDVHHDAVVRAVGDVELVRRAVIHSIDPGRRAEPSSRGCRPVGAEVDVGLADHTIGIRAGSRG